MNFTLLTFISGLARSIASVLGVAILKTLSDFDINAETISAKPIYLLIIISLIIQFASVSILPRRRKKKT